MIYTSILKLNTVIADYSEDQGDYPFVMTKILKANRQNLEFYVVGYLNYDFYFLHSEDHTFSCIASQNLDNEKILLFLQSLKESFLAICLNDRDNLTYRTTNLIRDLMV
jgi:hypothetical protein